MCKRLIQEVIVVSEDCTLKDFDEHYIKSKWPKKTFGQNEMKTSNFRHHTEI